MPRERLPMRKIYDVLRLHAGGLSKRRIAVSLNIGRTAVGDYLRRARRAGLGWPLPEGLSDEDLERLLFPPPPAVSLDRRPPPDWPALHRELKRPGVTLSLLWEEYRSVHPGGYGYSRFCDLYRDWRGRLNPTMRQAHVVGEKLFVDYAGATMEVIDGLTGEIRTAQVFVATLGASSYTYAEATWTQALPDWIGSHIRAFAYFGGVPRQVVPDNLKSGVVKACLYDPEINRTYAGMAAHYDTAIVPARPRKPRDKAKVEVGVQIVERRILARLRNHRFFSLAELNQAIAELLVALNGRVTRHLGASRRQLFEQLDRPALSRCLPKPTSMPNGSSAAPASIIMSRSPSIIIPSPMPWPNKSSGLGSPIAPSRSSIKVNASRPTCAVPATGATPPCPNTCRPRIAVTPIGPRIASVATLPPTGSTPRS